MKKITSLLAVLCFFSLTGTAQSAGLRRQHFNLDEEVAIRGYDPVAYFKNAAAVKGQPALAVFHQGITYYFSSVENKEAFKKNPSAYEPAYGGWCAYAMGAKASKVEVNPETFRITDGRLFLFYNRRGTNTLNSWNKEEAGLKAKADQNWKNIFH